MKEQHQNTAGQQSRHDARVRGRAAFAAASCAGVVVMLGTLTAKINPRWVSGGLPRKGNS